MKLYDDQLIIITGAAGFIGSAVVRQLNELGYKNLILVDDFGKTEKWRNLVGKQFLDMLPKAEMFSWLAGRESTIEAFIHLGACSSTVETDASYLFTNNFAFSRDLAKYALRYEKRFIYASSAATYGDGGRGFVDDQAKLETLAPLNMYGYSKQMFDLWVKNEGVLDKVVGLKYFNVFGPNEAHKGRMASPIASMVRSAQNEGEIRLFRSGDPVNYGDGDQKRDFIYVKDVARMTCAFLTNEEGGIFNIGTGKASTWNELARAVFKALGKPPKITYIEMPADLIGKYQNYTCADMRKTQKTLKGAAKCDSLENSVADYIRNYLLPDKRW